VKPDAQKLGQECQKLDSSSMQSLQSRLQQRGPAAAFRQQRAVPRILASAAAAVPGTRTSKKQLVFPFTRIQGQEDMKLALLLNVVDPNIGGVLIMGDRGTAKSVAVRTVLWSLIASLLDRCSSQMVQSVTQLRSLSAAHISAAPSLSSLSHLVPNPNPDPHRSAP